MQKPTEVTENEASLCVQEIFEWISGPNYL